MWSWLAQQVSSFVIGFVSALLLVLLDPVKRALMRLWMAISPIRPLTVLVESRPERMWVGHPHPPLGSSFYVPKADLHMQPPGTQIEWPAWIREQNGCAEGSMIVSVSLACDADTTVIVAPPVVGDCTRVDLEASAVGLVWRPQGGPPVVPVAAFELDLSPAGSTVWFKGDLGDDQPKPLRWFMKKGDVLDLLILVRANQPGVYSWTLQLPLIIGGRSVLHKIKNTKRHPLKIARVGPDYPTYGWVPSVGWVNQQATNSSGQTGPSEHPLGGGARRSEPVI